MKLIVILLCVVLLGWFSIHSLFSSSSKSLFSGIGKFPESLGVPSSVHGGVSSPPVAPVFRPSVSGEGHAPGSAIKVSHVYRFLRRDPPAALDLSVATALGCVVSVDKYSRSAIVAGELDAVLTVEKILKDIDLDGGSCAVQTWAVYVDKSAQKGFDLVAAINAAAGAVSGFEVGGGGITLDLDGGAVSAALTAVCDGSVIEVIQRPHVQLQQGVVSRIESLQEVPVPNTAVSQGIAQTSVEYRKVGLQLEVTPYFLDGGRVRLGVVQSNGLLGLNVKIGENEVPIIQSQTVSSTVELTIGQSVVLGGVSTIRRKTVRGLLRDREEVSEGALYVILSTSSQIPRAVVVGDSLAPLTSGSVPFSVPSTDPSVWIDQQLLPPADWKKSEADFVRARGAK